MVEGLQGRPHVQRELAQGLELGNRLVGSGEPFLTPRQVTGSVTAARTPTLSHFSGVVKQVAKPPLPSCGVALGRGQVTCASQGEGQEGRAVPTLSLRFSPAVLRPQEPTAVPGAPCAGPSARSSPDPKTCARRSGPTPTNTAPSTGAAGAASRCGSTLPRGTPTRLWRDITLGKRDAPLLRWRTWLPRGTRLCVLCRGLCWPCCPWPWCCSRRSLGAVGSHGWGSLWLLCEGARPGLALQEEVAQVTLSVCPVLSTSCVVGP